MSERVKGMTKQDQALVRQALGRSAVLRQLAKRFEPFVGRGGHTVLLLRGTAELLDALAKKLTDKGGQ